MQVLLSFSETDHYFRIKQEVLLLLLIYFGKQNLRHFTNIKKTFTSQRFTARR